jgi:hypothetical protein
MSNVILGILGIILASAAALISIDYGGDYFVEGQRSSNAAVVLHAGQNFQQAFDLHVSRFNTAPLSPGDLVSTTVPVKRGFLTSLPFLNGNGTIQNSWLTSGTSTLLIIRAVPSETCIAINTRANASTSTTIPSSINNAWREGCYNLVGGQPVPDNTYFRKMVV